MAENKVKIGFVGVGTMGQCAHLRNYYALKEECEVTAIAEIRENTGRAVAAHYGVPNVYASAAEMLKEQRFDGIVASQPFTRHGTLLDTILEARTPVFIEKPLAGSVQVAQTILDKCKGTQTQVMVGYHKRSDLATEYVKTLIDNLKGSNDLGKMTYIRILMPAGDWIAGGFYDHINCEEGKLPELTWDPPADDMDEDTYNEYLGFVNYYIHQVNLMRHLLGEDYRVSYVDPAKVLLIGQSESGIPCSIEMSPFTTTIDWQEQAVVCFEHGWIKLDLPAPVAMNRPGKVEVFRDKKELGEPQTTIPQFDWVHAMKNQAMNFIRFIRGEMAAPCLAEEAIKDLDVARQYIRLLRNK